MKKVYVVDAVRSAVGKFGGALSAVRPDDLLADIIKGLLDRNPNIDLTEIEDVISGCANQAGEDNRNVARMSALMAGLPVTVGGNTVNRLCASGLQAIMDAARAIMCGDGNIYLAGGVESMSRAPYVMNKPEAAFSRHPEVYDTTIGWRFKNKRLMEKYYPYSMGETAENVARKWNVSRADQDRFALSSQQKFFKALEEGRWNDEIIPVEITPRKAEKFWFSVDEHPRHTSMEKLLKLKPAFLEGGTVTAGNSSGINDGASMLMLANEDVVKKYDLKPMALIKSMATAGVDPAIMGIGPIPSTKKALSRAGLEVRDLGLIELNEAFASQSVVCMRGLDFDESIVNVNGGAIAIGHPLGCSGARIATTLLHEMRRKDVKYGLATMCVGVGQGAAMIFEKC